MLELMFDKWVDYNMVSLKSYGLLLPSWLRWIDHYLLGQISNPLLCPRALVLWGLHNKPMVSNKFWRGQKASWCRIWELTVEQGATQKGVLAMKNFPKVWFAVKRTSIDQPGCTITTSTVKAWTQPELVRTSTSEWSASAKQSPKFMHELTMWTRQVYPGVAFTLQASA